MLTRTSTDETREHWYDDSVPVDGNEFLPIASHLKKSQREGNFLSRLRSCSPKKRPTCPQFLQTYIPILYWLPRYHIKENLLKDVIAGLTVGTLAVPQALGYAIVAGVAPIFGLYTCFICPLIYTILGTSRHVSVGTFALVALMTGETVADVLDRQSLVHLPGSFSTSNSTNDSSVLESVITASEVASTLAVLVGIWQVSLGMLGLGALTVYLSDRLIKGFACGAAVHIVCTQLKWVAGLSLPKHRGFFNLIFTLFDFCRLLPHAHLPTCIVSGTCLIALIIAKIINQNARIMKVIRFPIPMELFVIIFGSLASYLMDLKVEYGVDIIQTIPLGLPQPHLPRFSIVPEIIVDSLLIAVISFSVAASAARLFAQKHNYPIHGNQELRAIGVASFVSGFFQCIPSSVALARSMVQESVGGMTQVVSIVMGSVVLLVITVLGPFLEPVPKTCLGCIIIVALSPTLWTVTDAMIFWKISRTEALIFLVPLVSIVILDVEIGLLIGVMFSLFITVILKSQTAKVQILGTAKVTQRLTKLDTTDLGVELPKVEYVHQVEEIPGIRILRLAAPLYFANAEMCLKRIRKVAFSQLCPNVVPGGKNGMDDRGSKVKVEAGDKIKAGGTVHSPISKDSSEFEDKNSQNSANHRAEMVASDLTQKIHLTSPWSEGNIDVTPSEVDLMIKSSIDREPVRIEGLILDMVGVPFVDITGVQELIKLWKECQSRTCRFFLASCSADVSKTFERHHLSMSKATENSILTVVTVSVPDAVRRCHYNS